MDDAPRAVVRDVSGAAGNADEADYYVVWTNVYGLELVWLVDGTWDWIVNVESNAPCRAGFPPPWVGTESDARRRALEIERELQAHLRYLDPGAE